jgi:SpoVK/Ycf46/Vps4 family AAA+-type ATPase
LCWHIGTNNRNEREREDRRQESLSMGAREAVGEEAVSTTASLAVAHANKQGLFPKVVEALGKVGKFLGKPPSAHAAAVPGQGGGQMQWGIVVTDLLYMGATLLGSLVVLKLTLSHLDPNKAAAKQAKQRKKEIKQRLGRSITTNTYEDVVACDVINPDHLSVSFDRIGGLQTIKERLFELVILPLRRPDLFARGNLLKPVKGVLLYGPPGTGKTMLAKAIAKESNASFINVRAATLQSKWFGDAQKLVTAVFTLALKLQPSIIFIDEIDSMLGKRHSNEHEAVNNMKTEFMALWDGFTTDEYSQVMVLGATNRPWEVDEAVLRRLPQSFLVGLPDENQRIAILSKMLEGEVMDESFYAAQAMKKLGKKTAGYSGSDLKQLCTNAAYYPIRELLVAERKKPSAIGTIHPRSLTMEDFIQALDHSKPTGAEAMKYMKTKVMENSYNQLGMYFNQGLDQEEEEKEEEENEEEIKAFDPLKMFKNSNK